MKILVLGAQGMLGQAIMSTWPEHQLIGLDRPEIDITKPLDISHALVTYQPQAVINCAAYTAVDQCETEEELADRVNGTAVGYIARACEAQRLPVVHISTDYVFDGLKQEGYLEKDEPGPAVNAYGRTKLHGEEQLRLNTSRFYLVRTSWLYGSGGKNFVQTMLELGQTKKEVQVVADQHGKPTFTRDLSLFIKGLVQERAPYGVYHGVNEEPTTWRDFAVEIFRQAGLNFVVQPGPTAAFPRPANRPAWSILLNTKRPAMRLWSEALADYLAGLAEAN
jgi:dTDP-4-dehydrorhamnose reductase